MTKTLTAIILATTLGTNCSTPNGTQYNFDGPIGFQEIATFRVEFGFMFNKENYLIVTKANGNTITFADNSADDLKIEYLAIRDKNGIKYYYPNDEAGKTVVEEGQKQFDAYLQNIKEKKTNDALKSINDALTSLK